jgi:hypothetical protein
MHPYMSEQLAGLRQRDMLEHAAEARLIRRKQSWLRRSFSALRRSPDQRRQPRPVTIGHTPQPQHVTDAVVAD